MPRVRGSRFSVATLTVCGALTAALIATPASAAPGPLQAPTELELSAAKTVVTFPNDPRLVGTLTSLDVTGGPLEDQLVLLERRVDGEWEVVNEKYTDSEGQVAFSPRTKERTRYRLHYDETTEYAASTSDPVVIRVRPRLHADFPAIAETFTRSTIPGHVSPRTRGQVKLQRHRNGEWRAIDVDRTGVKGRFRLHLEPTTTAPLTLRIRWVKSHGLMTTTTRTKHIEVVARGLQAGDTGSDVRTLQKRLRHLHYDVGSVDGRYGYDTTHAVAAFQKVQRTRVTGEVGSRTWKQLADPRRIKMRHPRDGAAWEVNIRRQVVLYGVDGKVRRILDASSGGGYTYTDSSGGTSKAVTPRGHFSFQYKIDGWHEAKLGMMYSPAYFNNTGYAIHGSNSVPAHPASHGCVRITVPSMDRMNDKMVVGRSVWIYGRDP